MFLNNADNIGYDNRASGLEAGNVQGALDELGKKFFLVKQTISTDRSGVQIEFPEGLDHTNSLCVAIGLKRLDGVIYPFNVGQWETSGGGYFTMLNNTYLRTGEVVFTLLMRV